jgi:hypothetical protein
VRLKSNASSNSSNYWQLQYSTDNANWNVAGVYFDKLADATKSVGGITARYWRIYQGSSTSGNPGAYSFEIIGPVEAPPPPENPAASYINAWLNGLETHYVPTVEDWLDSH